MTERELLVDCLRRLNGTAITYYLTGPMASNYWGHRDPEGESDLGNRRVANPFCCRGNAPWFLLGSPRALANEQFLSTALIPAPQSGTIDAVILILCDSPWHSRLCC